jgi:hypothetical protein
MDFITIASFAFGLLWGLWPVLLIGGLGSFSMGGSEFRGKMTADSSGSSFSGRFGRRLHLAFAFFFSWILLALMRLLLVFRPAPILSILMPEPLSTIVFVLVGMVGFVLWLLVRLWRRRGHASQRG